MRLTEDGHRLVAADTPGCLWLFGLLFVLSGSLVLALPVVSAEWASLGPWERAGCVIIGASHLAAGLWTIRRHPDTRTEFDRDAGSGRHLVRRPGARHVQETRFALSELRSVTLRFATDNEDVPMYQLQLRLNDGRVLLMQGQPVHGEARAQQSLQVIRRFLGHPVPTLPHGGAVQARPREHGPSRDR